MIRKSRMHMIILIDIHRGSDEHLLRSSTINLDISIHSLNVMQYIITTQCIHIAIKKSLTKS